MEPIQLDGLCYLIVLPKKIYSGLKLEYLLRFKPPRQRTFYQCRLHFEGTSADGMYRLGHSDSVKIVEEN